MTERSDNRKYSVYNLDGFVKNQNVDFSSL